MKDAAASRGRRVRVWDWPTRIVHWLFVLLVPFAWWTAEEHEFDWHRRIGYLMLGLLLFRLLWGFIGSSTARFANFVRSPGETWHYARGAGNRTKVVGHNPLGAWSVLALLGLMVAQVALGLFAIDVDGLEGGPLSGSVSFDTARAAAELHEIVFNILLAFIALHIAAILFYTFIRRQKIVAAMFTGSTMAEEGADLAPASPWRLLVAAVVAFAAMSWVAS